MWCIILLAGVNATVGLAVLAAIDFEDARVYKWFKSIEDDVPAMWIARVCQFGACSIWPFWLYFRVKYWIKWRE